MSGQEPSGAGSAAPRLIAIGDSITKGEGAASLGIVCHSWADWLARSLDLSLLNLAENGATVPQMLAEQVPSASPGAAVATIYAGVNDARSPAFDLERFRHDLGALFASVAPQATRVVTCTIPLDLGRPRAGATKVLAANAVIHEMADRHGAAVADLVDLRGPTLVQPDAVHPTAAGQLEIADRAARVLALGPLPSTLVPVDRSPRSLARFAVTRHGPAQLRDWARQAIEGLDRRRSR